jgi:hypothetical protein
MNLLSRLRPAAQPGLRPRRRQRLRRFIPLGSGVLAVALVATAIATASTGPSEADKLEAYIAANAQSLVVPKTVTTPAVARDIYSATPGIATLAASGTNHDWAKLVLISGGWEMSENNVTVILRWMRQENGTADWWNRNNPLNSGYGSGGGGGLGTYDNLVIAGQKVAELLHRNAGYASIVAALAESASTDVTERAIWASPWATGHYDNGGHWSSAEVPVVKAPESAWQ